MPISSQGAPDISTSTASGERRFSNEDRAVKFRLTDIDVDKVHSMDGIDQIPALQGIGRAVAREQIQEDDSKDFFTAK